TSCSVKPHSRFSVGASAARANPITPDSRAALAPTRRACTRSIRAHGLQVVVFPVFQPVEQMGLFRAGHAAPATHHTAPQRVLHAAPVDTSPFVITGLFPGAGSTDGDRLPDRHAATDRFIRNIDR